MVYTKHICVFYNTVSFRLVEGKTGRAHTPPGGTVDGSSFVGHGRHGRPGWAGWTSSRASTTSSTDSCRRCRSRRDRCPCPRFRTCGSPLGWGGCAIVLRRCRLAPAPVRGPICNKRRSHAESRRYIPRKPATGVGIAKLPASVITRCLDGSGVDGSDPQQHKLLEIGRREHHHYYQRVDGQKDAERAADPIKKDQRELPPCTKCSGGWLPPFAIPTM